MIRIIICNFSNLNKNEHQAKGRPQTIEVYIGDAPKVTQRNDFEQCMI